MISRSCWLVLVLAEAGVVVLTAPVLLLVLAAPGVSVAARGPEDERSCVAGLSGIPSEESPILVVVLCVESGRVTSEIAHQLAGPLGGTRFSHHGEGDSNIEARGISVRTGHASPHR